MTSRYIPARSPISLRINSTEEEIARALGVPTAFVEPVVKRLTEGELMYRAEGSRKVYTDFIIYTDEDRKATFVKQRFPMASHLPPSLR